MKPLQFVTDHRRLQSRTTSTFQSTISVDILHLFSSLCQSNSGIKMKWLTYMETKALLVLIACLLFAIGVDKCKYCNWYTKTFCLVSFWTKFHPHYWYMNNSILSNLKTAIVCWNKSKPMNNGRKLSWQLFSILFCYKKRHIHIHFSLLIIIN